MNLGKKPTKWKGGCSMIPRYTLIRRSSLQSVSSRRMVNPRNGTHVHVISALGDGKAKYHPHNISLTLNSTLGTKHLSW